jgi:hypothetical protein
VTTDLWGAWSAASGKDIEALMGVWTGRMGFPVVQVTDVDEATGDVSLTQEWYLSDGGALSEDERALVWPIPLFVGGGSASKTEMVMFTTKTLTLPGAAKKEGGVVVINAGQQVLLRVSYGPLLLPRLARSLSALSPSDRAATLSDALALAKSRRAPVDHVLQLLSALGGEDSYVVWSTAASALAYVVVLVAAGVRWVCRAVCSTVVVRGRTHSCMRCSACLPAGRPSCLPASLSVCGKPTRSLHLARLALLCESLSTGGVCVCVYVCSCVSCLSVRACVCACMHTRVRVRVRLVCASCAFVVVGVVWLHSSHSIGTCTARCRT